MNTPIRRLPRRPAAPAAPASPSQPEPVAITPPAAPRAPRRVIPVAAAKAVKTVAQQANGPVDTEQAAPLAKVDYNGVVKKYKAKISNRASAIRAHCVECSCGVLSEVRNCTVTACALYPFRNGSDPFRKKRTDGFAANSDEEEE